MYSYHQSSKKLLMFGIMTLLFISSQAFGFDLLGEMSSLFDKYSRSNDYMNDFYNAKHSKDPFGDALKTVDDMSIQIKLSGVEYIKNALSEQNCGMSQKKIIGILYYFSPDFRADLARSLKMKSGNVDNKNYIFSGETIAKYCNEYYKCVNKDNDKSSYWNKQKISELIAATPNAVEKSCMEFFVNHYDEGKINETLLQDAQKSQLGADKFWNATVDDSPYDIITDLETVGKFLFQEVEGPITPVFYNLPVFSKSAKSLADNNSSNLGGNGGGSVNNEWGNIGGGEENNADGVNGVVGDAGTNQEFQVDQVNDNNENNGDTGGGQFTNPLKDGLETLDDVFDNMVEGLVLSDTNGAFKGVMCNDEEEVSEPEPEPMESKNNTKSDDSISESLALSPEEFQAAVDFMLAAVNNYSSLTEDEKDEIAKKAGDTSRYVQNNGSSSQETQLQRIADEIKTCWKSCEGLRFDQEASCKLMCACGEWKSPIFNPEDTPGLGPIAMIKFCTVPGVDNRFSVGGRKMVGIEEGVKEIFGVVDKLSREGRLGIWTQQYNFLDSSTKKMNFFETMAFSINIDWRDITDNGSEQSQQYKEKDANMSNVTWQRDSHIRNSLDNPVSKNRYRIFNDSVINDYSTSSNKRASEQAGNISVETKSVVDQTEVSKYDRYVKSSADLDMWMDQEGEFWNYTLDWIKELTDAANHLLSKKG